MKVLFFFPCQSLRLIFETVFLFNSRSSKFCSWTCADEMNTFLLRIYFVCKKIISPSTFILEDPGRTKEVEQKTTWRVHHEVNFPWRFPGTFDSIHIPGVFWLAKWKRCFFGPKHRSVPRGGPRADRYKWCEISPTNGLINLYLGWFHPTYRSYLTPFITGTNVMGPTS